MAYTLTDPFGSLRNVLRLSASTDLLLGGTLLVFPRLLLAEWGAPGIEVLWPARLAGAALVTLAIYYLMAANGRSIGLTAMVVCMLGNGLLALVLLLSYLQQDLANLTLLGLIVLVALFIVALIGAIAPVRYLRAEYQDA